jgi:hypothetical protein
MTTYYAAIDRADPAVAVYGIGTSPAAALANAESEGQVERGQDPASQFRVVPCSVAAYVYVTHHGGAPNRELDVSSRGVTLASEEE